MIAAISEVHPKEYLELMDLWNKQVNFFLDDHQLNEVLFNPVASIFLNHMPFASYIIEVDTQKISFASNNFKQIFGCEAMSLTEGGLKYKNQLIHHEDLAGIWKFFKTYWKLLDDAPSDIRSKYKFNFDYRTIKANKEETRVFEQVVVFQQDTLGNITHFLGTCTEIPGWKKGAEQTVSITSAHDDKTIFLQPEARGSTDPQADLSKREIEIVKLLSQGYSSKCIADKLHISFNTVNTHRQHMIRKTNTKNTGELIQLAGGRGWI